MAQDNSHHEVSNPHWTDRALVKAGGKFFIYRVDDPGGLEVDSVQIGELCFHVLESGAA